MTTVGALLVQTFSAAKQKQQTLNNAWVQISHRVGGRLPTSLLSVAIQRDGDLDLLLRAMEDEQADRMQSELDSGMFECHYQHMMSVYWVGGIYETLAVLRRRNIAGTNPVFQEMLGDAEMVRVTLEKHEIAKDRTLKTPLPMSRAPANNDATDQYIYDPKDPLRSHIMPSGVSARGSIMWSVLDLKNNTMKWIERRTLSDKLLSLWSPNDQNTT